MDVPNVSGIGRGTKMWFIQMTPLNAGGNPVTPQPTHARWDELCMVVCARAEIGKGEE